MTQEGYGDRSVGMTFSLARVDAQFSDGAVPVAMLLVGQIDRAMRFAVSCALLPVGAGGFKNGEAQALCDELEAALAVHVDAVLANGGAEQTLSAPAQTLHAALRTSQLGVGAIRAERRLEVPLCDALATARDIARQQLLHEQSRQATIPSERLTIERSFGPVRIDDEPEQKPAPKQ